MNEMTLTSKIRDYKVFFEKDFNFFDKLKNIQPKVIIIDANVYNLYRDLFQVYFGDDEVVLFNAIEENKTIENCMLLYEQIILKASKKNITIISIGGGITQDVTGFVASTLYRGVNWIFIPTTFLAQTDSCIGSKTSLNFKSYKNLIGTFYPPSLIYINTQFLNTLTALDFYSGIGETIKFQLMKEERPKDINKIKLIIDKALKKDDFLIDLIQDNMKTKISFMENDEFDQGRRNLLNYGHCLGHALETSSNYFIPHGIAVIIGIMFANILANMRNMLSDELLRSMIADILLPNNPLELKPDYFNEDILLESMKKDKKKIGNLLTVVIPNENLEIIKVDDVTDQEAKEGIRRLKKFLFVKEEKSE